MQNNRQNHKNRFLRRIVSLLAVLALLLGAWAAVSSGSGSLFLPDAARADSAWKTLKKGSSGAEVRRAQQALKALGYYSGNTDGNFSRAFEEAVIAFQEDFGLEATGQLDEDTYLLITEDLGDAPPETTAPAEKASPAPAEEPFVVKGEEYSDRDHVAAYLHAFGELPPNYITKWDAQLLGWISSARNLWKVAPGKSIGGDRFGNYEGQLPKARGRTYYECDIDFDGGSRNAKRIVFSSDGLIFYTEDHYNTFVEIIFDSRGVPVTR